MSSPIEIHNSGLLQFSGPHTRRLAEHLGGMFLDDFAVDGDNVWSYFYVPAPDVSKGHKHYVRLRLHPTAGLRIAEYDPETLWSPGIYDPKHHVFAYSRYQHDFYHCADIGIAIDGGRTWFRFVGERIREVVSAEFNPHTMQVRARDNDSAAHRNILGVGQFASASYRDLRT